MSLQSFDPRFESGCRLQNLRRENALFINAIIYCFFVVGCSNTWHGVKEDTNNAVEWSKEKVNKGASYIKEKTE